MSSDPPDSNSLRLRSPCDNGFVVVNTQLFSSLFVDTYSESRYVIRYGTKFEFITPSPNAIVNIAAEKQHRLENGTFEGYYAKKRTNFFTFSRVFAAVGCQRSKRFRGNRNCLRAKV